MYVFLSLSAAFDSVSHQLFEIISSLSFHATYSPVLLSSSPFFAIPNLLWYLLLPPTIEFWCFSGLISGLFKNNTLFLNESIYPFIFRATYMLMTCRFNCPPHSSSLSSIVIQLALYLASLMGHLTLSYIELVIYFSITVFLFSKWQYHLSTQIKMLSSIRIVLASFYTSASHPFFP